MRWPARFRTDERGFTLVELLIGMVIVSLLIGAMGSALIVSLRTTGVTNQRMSENHDVQITSSYLANDVQSAASVSVSNATTDCSGAFTTLVTFTYWAPGNPPTPTGPTAVYKCGTASGETQVTRTFNGSTVVAAHFAGATRPDVTVAYDPSQTTVPVSVKMTFTKASDCTLDCTYTLFGSRRSFNAATAGAGTSSVPDITLLSTGSSSPLWVQGKCQDPGTSPSSACTWDPFVTALPIFPDVQTTGWSVTPLYDKLRDQDQTTYVTSPLGSNAEASVSLSGVDPPDNNFKPVVEFHASKVSGSGPKVALSLYDGSTSPPTLLTSTSGGGAGGNVGPVNQPGPYDWQLTSAQTNSIPAAAYAHLVLGFKLFNPSGTDQVKVDGVALDTASPVGLLTINGPLYVNSPLSNAVRLSGSKTDTKISIISHPGTTDGKFQIWNPGACSGCNHSTVTCVDCVWTGQQPWTNYANSIPDPLRSLPAPDPSTLGIGSCNASGVCQPGVYSSTLSRTSNTSLNPGIYYLQRGISITGSASLTCSSPCTGGVMLYIAGAPTNADGSPCATCSSVTFAGSSTVNLPAPSSGLYTNIVIFQARAVTNPLKITGNAGSTATNVFGGIVYVPNSVQVTLATGSASLTATAIVAQNIKVSSSVTIG